MTNPLGGGLLKKIKDIQEQMGRVQEELKRMRVQGQAGGGMVTATVNGHKELVALKIEPEALAGGDVEMLQDLIVAAAADAAQGAAREAQSRLADITGGILPPGIDLGGLMGP